MDISSAKDLVPAKRFLPVPKPVRLEMVSYDLYPRQYQDQVVFAVCVPDESDGKYGPDGRLLKKHKYAEYIDVYV